MTCEAHTYKYATDNIFSMIKCRQPLFIYKIVSTDPKAFNDKRLIEIVTIAFVLKRSLPVTESVTGGIRKD